MVLEKKADDELDRICEKWRDVAKSPGGGEYPTKIKKKKRKAYWIGHILFRNCLLKHVIEGKVDGWTEVRRGRGKRSKQLLGEREDAVN